MSGAVLVFDRVTKVFARPGDRLFKKSVVVAVEKLDLEVHPGEMLAITGPSGAGKSTIAQLMVGLTRPTSGRITFEGRETAGYGPAAGTAGRRQIVFQNPYRSLSPRLTVEEIVCEPALIIGTRVDSDHLLDLVGLDSRFRHRYPSQLSTGERQRVALARALSTDPALLVLDEPTSSLDPINASQINRLVGEMSGNRSVVLVTHDRTMLGRADRCLVVESQQLITSAQAL